MDPDVVHDPVYAELAHKFELASRKLRESVVAMRSFYLTHHKRPLDETTAEQWRGALLSEEAAQRHEEVVESAAQLLRYAFELAPHSNSALHLEEIYKLKAAHRERVERRTGWGKRAAHLRGIEEKVEVDGGPPLTIVLDPKHWSYSQQAERIRRRKAQAEEPAMNPEESPRDLSDPDE